MKKMISLLLAVCTIIMFGGVQAFAAVVEDTLDDSGDSSASLFAITDRVIFDGGGTITDSDYDGRFDELDTAPNSNVFGGTLYTNYATTSVSYTMDYRWFFGNNTSYRNDLAVVSSLLSTIAYKDNKMDITSGGTKTMTAESAVSDWMYFHGMSTIEHHNLSDEAYDDYHLSEMWIGKTSVSYNSARKSVICVVIRGTNSTLAEWSSNFDVGSTATAHEEWTNSDNHMGFDITANRLNDKLKKYLDEKCDGEDCVLWITGHSRGGALANLIAAKQVDAGNEVFAYTFASPNTTQQENADTAAKYKCIFNIVNDDDLITQIPLTEWGFCRFGEDREKSISALYATEWNVLTGMNYTCDNTKKNEVKAAFYKAAATRTACYVERSNGYVPCAIPFYTEDAAALAGQGKIESYPVNARTMCSVSVMGTSENYFYRIYQEPAFLFQLLAATVAGEITGIQFAAIDVAGYLEDAKWTISFYYLNNGFEHPHYLESYYLLAQNIE